jgi:hypothetical protein
MTTKEKLKLVETLVNHYKEMDKRSDEMNKLLGIRVDCPAMNPFWRAFDGYLDAVAALVGDANCEWIFWFIFENGCGEKAMSAGYDKRLRKISTVKQLVNLIEQGSSRKTEKV